MCPGPLTVCVCHPPSAAEREAESEGCFVRWMDYTVLQGEVCPWEQRWRKPQTSFKETETQTLAGLSRDTAASCPDRIRSHSAISRSANLGQTPTYDRITGCINNFPESGEMKCWRHLLYFIFKCGTFSSQYISRLRWLRHRIDLSVKSASESFVLQFNLSFPTCLFWGFFSFHIQ